MIINMISSKISNFKLYLPYVVRRISSSFISQCDKASKDENFKPTEEKPEEEKDYVSPLKLLDNAADFRDLVPESTNDIWTTPTYPKGVPNPKQDQARHSSINPAIDPCSVSIVLFPGQGFQYIGMSKDLLKYPNVKDMFDAASSILGYDLLDVCLFGPKSKLDQTEFCQPAIVVSSLAAVEKLKDDRPYVMDDVVATAGFSVGEITALIFAGSISFEDGIKLVKVRAEAMQACSEMVPSGMMTVFYNPDSKLKYACHVAKLWCKKQGIEDVDCCIANYLYPGCKVIAGNAEALEFIIKHAEEFNLKKMKKLPVSGAFHTKLMKPAVSVMVDTMDTITVEDPRIAVHTNANGVAYVDSKHIIRQLPHQISTPVRWEQIMHILYERSAGTNFPRTYECGPGNSLSAILRKVNFKASAVCTSYTS